MPIRKGHPRNLMLALVSICLIVWTVAGSATKASRSSPNKKISSVHHDESSFGPVPRISALSSADWQSQTRLNRTYGRLPLSFEANQGQAVSEVKFLSRGSGYSLYLTPTEAILALRSAAPKARIATTENLASRSEFYSGQSTVLRMRLVAARPTTQIEGVEQLTGKSNYFIGNDSTRWTKNISNYAKVRYRQAFPGVDLTYYGSQGNLEYDLVVAPGADPQAIALAFEGVRNMQIDARSGELVLDTNVGEIRQQKPAMYQKINGVNEEVSGRYVIKSTGEVGFEVGQYDSSKELVIDPVLAYAGYLGGGDGGFGVAVDSEGNAYVTGAAGPNFPAAPSAVQAGGGGVFVLKLNAEGTGLVYSTFLGGGVGRSIAVDSAGNAYVTGFTSSNNFPTTPGAIQGSYGGGASDAFVAKLNSTGSSLSYSTYLGGESGEAGYGVALDSAGNAYVTGFTNSNKFPTTPLAFQTDFAGGQTYGDIFVSRLNTTGTALVYSTYVGGSGDEGFLGGIAVDSSGSAYITGKTTSNNFPTTRGVFQNSYDSSRDSGDAFVAKLDPTGSGLVYSTYLGGNAVDEGRGIALDSSGNAYVCGFTASTDFPVTPRAFDMACSGCSSPPPGSGGGDPFVISGDAFVSKLNPTGTALVYSTFLGGSEDEGAYGIAVDSSGNACVTGVTNSEDFPTTRDAIQPPADSNEMFAARLNIKGSALLFSSYFGGRSSDVGHAIALDPAGNIYVTGYTLSSDIPMTSGTFRVAFNAGGNAFIAKIQMAPAVTGASATGNKLLVFGDNFDAGAVILVNGDEQKTRNDEQTPKTILIGKKAGKKIAPGQNALIQVRNADGMLSLGYIFNRQ